MKNIIILIVTCFCGLNGYSQQDLDFFLIARNTGEKVLANNDTIRVFGFAQSLGAQPSIPGPTLIMNEGDSVHIDLWNVSQGAPHTLHLHGLDVDQENDGVPHLSFDIAHMDHGYYHFKAPHAGTYLYHCHVASSIHVQAGMYGSIIVKPSDGSNTTWNGGYEYTNENSYFCSEIDTTWHNDSVLEHDHDTTITIHQVSIPKYKPQFFLINGLSDQQLIDENVTFNSVVNQIDYTRLTNIGYCGLRVFFPPALNARIIDSDGRPLPVEEISDTVYLYPGERYGVLTDASMEFSGEITFDYIDLNTMGVKNTQVVPVSISGDVDLEEFEKELFNFKVVPNPFHQEAKIKFKLNEAKKIKIRIIDVNGRILRDIPFSKYLSGKNSVIIGESLLLKGTYVVQMISEEGYVVIKKIIKL
ncbi:MAG: multicopper oxidase domain-containing protein [Crocinitomicaceae bacterium]|nr:multicopper oxidase domain-containing protein [Crocinitomicaceae bacterium]